MHSNAKASGGVMTKQLSRRTVLRGMGTVVALPFLEAMLPRTAQAATGKPPLRMLFFNTPNGAHMPDWRPAETGAGIS